MAISCCDNFFVNKVEANDSGSFAFLKVTPHCVPNLAPQFFKCVAFGEYRFSQSSRDVASFGSMLHHENHFFDANLLQSNNPGRAFFAQVAIESVARIDHQRRQVDHALIIDRAVVGHNHHTIRRLDFFVGELD